MFISSPSADALSLSTKFLYASPLVYIVPKVMSILCSRTLYERGGIIGRVDNLRNQLANLYGHFLENIGERKWQFFNEVIIDNAWISCLALGLLLKNSNKEMNFEMKESLVLAFFGISSLTWFLRYQITKNFPSTAFLLATRSQQ